MNARATHEHPVVAARFLEAALLFTFFAHAAAMLSMVLFLLPGLPGAAATTVTARAAYVGGHPWLWRLGWLPWQVTAVSDALLCVALLRTRWIPRLPAILSLLATAAALVPDQGGQLIWTWHGTALAHHAMAGGGIEQYAQFEAHIFRTIGGYGALGYTAGAICWTWCFAAAGAWSKRLTILSVAAWGMFALATVILLAARNIEAGSVAMIVTSAGNAVAFVLLMIWLMAVTDAVMGRKRLIADHGQYAPSHYPSSGLMALAYNLIANSHFARAATQLLPMLAMDSDITDVVYVNYLVETDRLERFVVAPLQLQHFGPDGRYAMFTFLSFRHGHFGPRCLGPWRRLLPSPIQSNWRIYVCDPATEKRGIQFLTIGINAVPYALGARLMAQNVPMHVVASAELSKTADGSLHLHLTSGQGSAPDVDATLRFCPEPALAPPWTACFASWRQMLEYCVPQDRAMSAQPWLRRVARQEIALNIPLDRCRPISGTIISKAADAIVGQAEPVCFLVDKLSFRLMKEEFDEVMPSCV